MCAIQNKETVGTRTTYINDARVTSNICSYNSPGAPGRAITVQLEFHLPLAYRKMMHLCTNKFMYLQSH